MAQNGERRMAANSPSTEKVPSIQSAMRQGTAEKGNAALPTIQSAMRQGSGKNGSAGIPSIQQTLRQGGGKVPKSK